MTIKLALTLISAVSSWMLAKLSESRWIGLLYWALPTSIWFVSGEGQFEPLQNFFVFAALLAFRRSVPAAFALLALAIQVKLAPILLLPWLVWRTYRDHRTELAGAALGFALGLLPTFVAAAFYPVLDVIRRTAGSFVFNPYFWNVTDGRMFLWVPMWLRIANAAASWAGLGLLAVYAKRSADRLAFAAPAGLLTVLKLSALAQFWYVLIWPSLVVTVPEKRARLRLLAFTVALDVYSLAQVLVGPIGFTMGDYWSGLTAFTRYAIGG